MDQILVNISRSFKSMTERAQYCHGKVQVLLASVEAVKSRLGDTKPEKEMLESLLAHKRRVDAAHSEVQRMQREKTTMLATTIDDFLQKYRDETIRLVAKLEIEVDQAINASAQILAKLERPKN